MNATSNQKVTPLEKVEDLRREVKYMVDLKLPTRLIVSYLAPRYDFRTVLALLQN